MWRVRSIKRIMRTTLAAFGLLALSLVLSSVSFGQIKSAIITGLVTDPGGSVVPGAIVSIVDQETNVPTLSVTDERGAFTAPYLTAGVYTVNVEKSGSGFAKYSRTDIAVSTAQTVKIEVT